MAHAMCEREGVPFNEVYKQTNEIYNRGFSGIRPNVVRPVLEYVPGKIGGHCVRANAKLLGYPLISAILDGVE